MSSNQIYLLTFAASLLISAVSFADSRVHGSVALGLEYDSNVAVDELDRSSNLSDTGRLYGAELEVAHDFNENISGKLLYNFDAVNYTEFSALNRLTHTAGVRLSADLQKFNLDTSYFFTNTQLDGNKFLTYHRFSPSISGFTSKRWFFRAAYVYGDKSLERRPGRDATSHGIESDGYYFWRGLRRYFNLGYTYRDENSRADRFTYNGHLLKLRAVQRFILKSGARSTLDFSIRFEQRDYQGVSPSIGEPRYDNRLRVILKHEYPITSKVTWSIYSDYSDYRSNLPSADYDQFILGTEFEWQF